VGIRAYRKKRNFAKTSEPAGARTKRAKRAPKFVVQKHDASRLHYDFRLEMEGVLRSWAVPKGPSLDPAAKRLAAHVEDHPLEYGGFEGVIPKGEYGAGPVIVWDRGTWTPDGDPVRAYRKGRIDFTLHGDRLRGAWVLVKIRGKGDGKEWLLIKRTDEFATPGESDALVADATTSVLSGRDLDDVSAGIPAVKPKKPVRKPTRFASSRATASRRAARMPDAPAPELCTLVDDAPEGDAWLHEIKLDGYRLLVRVERGNARVLTRRGKDWTERFRAIADAAEALPVRDALLDGECVVVDAKGRTDFQALQNALDADRDVDLTYFVFDLLHVDGEDLTSLPLIERKERLRAIVAKAPRGSPIRYSDHVRGNGAEFHRLACRRGLEGIVSKRADSPYVGRRGSDWLKIKCAQGQEVVVVGFTEPAGSRVGIGAILVGIHDAKGALRFAGKVGTGFDDATLQELRARFDGLERRAPPVVDPPKGARARGVHWIDPRLVAEVSFTQWTKDGRLRHPVFKGLREDKPAKDVVRERPKSAPRRRAPRAAAAISRPRATSRVADEDSRVAGVALSHPDRVLYPDQGVTKIELARYYEAVADRMLPHVADRPLTLVRCPEGAAGECFYQKHPSPGLPSSVGRVAIREKGAVLDYMTVDSLAGLVALVQIGALEIHAWGSKKDRVEEPDRIVFDLDPDPTTPWPRVIDAAKDVKKELDRLELASFLKTTGGKGLHVVVPLERRREQDWDVVKTFSHAVVASIARRAPDRYTTNMAKARRTGKVFLDYLRNGRGATAVAPYSSRAKPGAPVALPIGWDELTTRLAPDAFRVRDVAKIVARRRDPWRGIDDAARKITSSMIRALAET